MCVHVCVCVCVCVCTFDGSLVAADAALACPRQKLPAITATEPSTALRDACDPQKHTTHISHAATHCNTLYESLFVYISDEMYTHLALPSATPAVCKKTQFADR